MTPNIRDGLVGVQSKETAEKHAARRVTHYRLLMISMASMLTAIGCATTTNKQQTLVPNWCDNQPAAVMEAHDCFNQQFADMADSLEKAHKHIPLELHAQLAQVENLLRQMADVPLGKESSTEGVRLAIITYNSVCSAPAVIDDCDALATAITASGQTQLGHDIAEPATLCRVILNNGDQMLANLNQKEQQPGNVRPPRSGKSVPLSLARPQPTKPVANSNFAMLRLNRSNQSIPLLLPAPRATSP